MNTRLLYFLLVLCYCLFFSQEGNSQENITVNGQVTSSTVPLSNVHITSAKSKKSTITDNEGAFTIKVTTGDTLTFTYVGLKTVSKIINEGANFLKVEMTSSTNDLDEVEVKANNKKDAVPEKIQVNNGVPVSIVPSQYIDGKSLNKSAGTLINAIKGRVNGLKVLLNKNTMRYDVFLRNRNMFIPSASYKRDETTDGTIVWDVDGNIFKQPPNVDLAIVESVIVLSSLAQTNSYGNTGKNGVIVVRTKNYSFNQKIKKRNSAKNKYKKDAVSLNNLKSKKPDYIEVFEGINSSELAYKKYQEIYENNKHKASFHLSTVNHFIKNYNNTEHIVDILKDFEDETEEVEDYLAIAYKYQELQKKDEAIKMYKQILANNENSPEFNRNLANMYFENNDLQKSMKTYEAFFSRGNKIEENNIGEIMISEISLLAHLTNNQFKKLEENDVRILFEWNNSNATFEIEFVNPTGDTFSFNKDEDEATDKSNAKEFFIEKLLPTDNWLINVTYKGNKSYNPTSFKVTTYYNWGRKNQTQKIKTYDLTFKDVKTKLLKINRNEFLK